MELSSVFAILFTIILAFVERLLDVPSDLWHKGSLVYETIDMFAEFEAYNSISSVSRTLFL